MEEQSAIARDLGKAGVQVQNAGDVVAAINGAAKVYKAEYRTELVYHAQLEPLNSVSWVKDGGKSVEVWAGSQTPTHLKRSVGEALGITPENVLLHRTYLGGGFGRRSAMDHDWAVDSALVSKELGVPVKVIWSRESDVRFGRFKPMTAQYLQAAEDSNGRLTAWHHRLVADEALAMTDPVRFEKGKEFPRISTTGIHTDYDVPNILVEAVRNKLGVRMSAVRGVGSTVNQFAAESFVDEIAMARGDDPVEMRLELLRKSPAEQEVLRAVANHGGLEEGREGRPRSVLRDERGNLHGHHRARRRRSQQRRDPRAGNLDCGECGRADHAAQSGRTTAKRRHSLLEQFAQRAHHVQERRRSAIELLRLSSAAHVGSAGSAHAHRAVDAQSRWGSATSGELAWARRWPTLSFPPPDAACASRHFCRIACSRC